MQNETQSLTQIITESNLEVVESNNIIEKFGDYEFVAKEWESKAKAIVVTDASQKLKWRWQNST